MVDCLIFSDGTVHQNYPEKTLGPYRISTEIRKFGFTCQIIQLMSWFNEQELETICKKFIGKNTKIVGFSTTFFATIGPRKKEVSKINNLNKKLFQLLQLLRVSYPEVKIVFGGPNAAILRNLGYKCDAVILGYGESAIIKLLKGENLTVTDLIENTPVYNDNNTEFNFCNSTVDYQDSDCFDQDDVMILEVARGCIFRCKFCAYPLNGKKKLDYLKDPDILRNELITNYEKFKINKYMISDDTFNDNTEKLKILHEVFKSLPFKIYFSCYLRLDLLNAHREQIDLLLEMGLAGANFGIESFHPKAAQTIGKGAVFKNAKQLLHDLKTIYWKEKVKIQVGLIIGLPYETRESLSETEKWILDEENLVDKVTTGTLALTDPKRDPFPWKSEFQIEASKYGFYWPDKEDPSYWKNMYGPIKDVYEASILNGKIYEAHIKADRHGAGGFSLFVTYPFMKYSEERKTFEELMSMNRSEYVKWFIKNMNKARSKYISEYKRKILAL